MVGSRGAGHLARSLELARRISDEGTVVGVACGFGRWRNLVEAYGFTADLLYEPELSSPTCDGVGGLSAAELARAFNSELDLLKRRRPRLVICDWRMTGAVSAASASVPCIQIWNANWGFLAGYNGWSSASLRHRFDALGESWREPYAAFCRAANIAESRGIGEMFRGSANLIPDHYAFRSIDAAPDSADTHWLGPLVPWPAPGTPWERQPTRDVAVSFGGHELRNLVGIVQGAANLLGRALNVLPQTLKPRPDWSMWSFFPEELLKCQVVVTHGGIGSVYQALLAGKPVLVLPQHLEHLDNGHCVERLGVGRCLPLGEADQTRIADALMALAEAHVGYAADRFGNILRRSTPLETASRVVKEHLARV